MNDQPLPVRYRVSLATHVLTLCPGGMAEKAAGEFVARVINGGVFEDGKFGDDTEDSLDYSSIPDHELFGIRAGTYISQIADEDGLAVGGDDELIVQRGKAPDGVKFRVIVDLRKGECVDD